MLNIGLTGTIASGKSTVAAYFKKLGAQVISADEIARSLTEINQPALKKIIKKFGISILESNGELNRRKLRELIFQQSENRLWLENLLHPMIRKQIETEIHQAQASYCIVEIPLLKNRADYPYLNRVLLVLATPETQIRRIIARDHCSREHAIAILASQPLEQTYRNLADDIIVNKDSIENLQKEIIELDKNYRALSSRCRLM